MLPAWSSCGDISQSVGCSLHHGEKQGQELGDPQGKRQHDRGRREPEAPMFQSDKLSGSVSYSGPPRNLLPTHASASGLMEGDRTGSWPVAFWLLLWRKNWPSVSPPLVVKENWRLNSKCWWWDLELPPTTPLSVGTEGARGFRLVELGTVT